MGGNAKGSKKVMKKVKKNPKHQGTHPGEKSKKYPPSVLDGVKPLRTHSEISDHFQNLIVLFIAKVTPAVE